MQTALAMKKRLKQFVGGPEQRDGDNYQRYLDPSDSPIYSNHKPDQFAAVVQGAQ